jgi:adenosylhomocysteine nucleosidase
MHINSVKIGVISALREEQSGLIYSMHNAVTIQRGMRDYVSGRLWGIECVCVLSRIGKVAAAATTATLIETFGVSHIIFTGVAGAAAKGVRIGDIVVASQLVQHDMDASPLFPRFEVPLTGLSHFYSDRLLSELLLQAASQFMTQDFETAVSAEDRNTFALGRPLVHQGLIASGDEFISNSAQLARINASLPDILAIEMEGAAVAQVCFEFGIPFAVVRTISDKANEDSPVDFVLFLEKIAARYAYGIIRKFFSIIDKQGKTSH